MPFHQQKLTCLLNIQACLYFLCFTIVFKQLFPMEEHWLYNKNYTKSSSLHAISPWPCSASPTPTCPHIGGSAKPQMIMHTPYRDQCRLHSSSMWWSPWPHSDVTSYGDQRLHMQDVMDAPGISGGWAQVAAHTFRAHRRSMDLSFTMATRLVYTYLSSHTLKRGWGSWVAATSGEVCSTQGLLEVWQGSQGLRRLGKIESGRGFSHSRTELKDIHWREGSCLVS